jgi:hypothetical protein
MCRADVIDFHFLDGDTVLFLPLFRLEKVDIRCRRSGRRVFGFGERRQHRYVPRNDRWGRIVPVEVLVEAGGGGTG